MAIIRYNVKCVVCGRFISNQLAKHCYTKFFCKDRKDCYSYKVTHSCQGSGKV